MFPTTKRPGFTLVEMLIVLGIVIVLTVIAIPMTLRFQDRDQVAKAATIVQGTLVQAKYRALAEKRPIGIRLVAVPGSTTSFDQMVYIEDPGDFRDSWLWTGFNTGSIVTPKIMQVPAFDSPFSQSNPNWVNVVVPTTTYAPSQVLFGPYTTQWQEAPMPDGNNSMHIAQRPSFTFGTAALPRVSIGDYVELLGGGQIYQVMYVEYTPGAGIPPYLVVDRPLLADVQVPRDLQPNYRIIRQPRLIAGEKPVKLPSAVVIDLTDVNSTTPVYNAAGYYSSGLSKIQLGVGYDILFSPNSQVLGVNGGPDMVVLWVRDPNLIIGGLDSATNQALTVVYTKTGAVTVYPVDSTAPVLPATTGNPWSFAQYGRGGGGL